MSSYGFTVPYDSVQDQIRTFCNVSKFRGDNRALKKKIQLVGVWDTGAKITTISTELVQKLKLEKAGKITVRTIAGETEHAAYRIDLILSSYVKIPSLLVMEGELDGFDVLIGMDVISRGDFAISNAGGKTTFSFRIPPESIIDFCKLEKRKRAEEEANRAVQTEPSKTPKRPWWRKIFAF